MKPQAIFNHLLRSLTPLLKPHGYTRTRNTFRKWQGNNQGVIYFWKDKWNTQEDVKFAISIGAYSLIIDQYLSWISSLPIAPGIPDCHWQEGIHGNLRDTYEGFWGIDGTTSVEEFTKAVHTSILTQGVPAIDQHITDEQLKAHWLAGGVGGGLISAFMRLRQLSILLKVSGEKEKLELVLSEIEEYARSSKPPAAVAREHIQKMRAEIPQEIKAIIKQEN